MAQLNSLPLRFLLDLSHDEQMKLILEVRKRRTAVVKKDKTDRALIRRIEAMLQDGDNEGLVSMYEMLSTKLGSE